MPTRSQMCTLKLDLMAMAKFKVYGGVRTPYLELVASE